MMQLPKEYKSDFRSLVHAAQDWDYKPLCNYDAAQNIENGCVVFEGDDGGQIYLTCPMKYVFCSHDTLWELAKDIDKLFWNDVSMLHLCYESIAINSGVAGGMGGGLVTDGLWIHDSLKENGLFERILSVVAGEKPCL